MNETKWRLTHDLVLPFGRRRPILTPLGSQLLGVVHVRAYEAGDDIKPIVIFGEFSDHVGLSSWQATTYYAASAQSYLYPEGC
jgi:hypothetical protein